jgi:hypothetical protein
MSEKSAPLMQLKRSASCTQNAVFVFLAGNETDGRERFLAAGYLFHVRIGIAAGLERFDPMRLQLVLLPDPKHSDEKQGAESCPTYYYFLLLHAPVVVDLEIGGGSRT